MSETFQLYCPSCNSKLNAKVSAIGQTRNCPKCNASILIQQQFVLDEPVKEPAITELAEGISANPNSVRIPQLEFNNRYFIISSDRIIAIWEGSKGWHVNVGSGFAPARSNPTAIPDQGVFAFVEMVMESGIPHKLVISKISTRAALVVLTRDANEILGKLEEHVDLTLAQKDVLLRHLRQMFMSTVLDNADEVIAYLTSGM